MNTQIHIRTDATLKTEMRKAAAEMGVGLSFILNGLARKFLKNKTVTLKRERVKRTSLKIHATGKKSYHEGKDSPAFKTGEEAVKWLEQH